MPIDTAQRVLEQIPKAELLHMQRVGKLVHTMAKLIPRSRYHAQPTDHFDVYGVAAHYHDIGKAFVPASILTKASRLTGEEYKLVFMHPVYAQRYLDETDLPVDDHLKALIYDSAVYHHERWDGKGYPYGLARHEIPLIARVTAVCDAYDAMTHERPYSKARSHHQACLEIGKNAGFQFDPEIAYLFIKHEALINHSRESHRNDFAERYNDFSLIKHLMKGEALMRQEQVVLEKDTQQGRYLLCRIGDELYGIDIRYVTEIIGMQRVSKLPEQPEYIMGVINLRGRIIPVADMRIRFQKQAAECTSRTCIVVVDTEVLSTGLIVDEVVEVRLIKEEDIAPPPSLEWGAAKRYVDGIGNKDGQVVLLLNCETLFTDEEARTLESMKKGDMENEMV